MLQDKPEEEIRETLDEQTHADAIVVEEYDEGKVVRLAYHPPEKDYDSIRTRLGRAIVVTQKEKALTQSECERKFEIFKPDEIIKRTWEDGNHFEVVLIYENE